MGDLRVNTEAVQSPLHSYASTPATQLTKTEEKTARVVELKLSVSEKRADTMKELREFIFTALDTNKYSIIGGIISLCIGVFVPVAPIAYAAMLGIGKLAEEAVSRGAGAATDAMKEEISGSAGTKNASIFLSKNLAKASEELAPVGGQPIHAAAKVGSYYEVKRLMSAEGGVDIQSTTSTGKTPLHFAIESGRPAVINLLLEHKADINAQDGNGITPFQLAVDSGNPELVETLLKNTGSPVSAKNIVDTLVKLKDPSNIQRGVLERLKIGDSPEKKIYDMLKGALYSEKSIQEMAQLPPEQFETIADEVLSMKPTTTILQNQHFGLIKGCLHQAIKSGNIDVAFSITGALNKEGILTSHTKLSLQEVARQAKTGSSQELDRLLQEESPINKELTKSLDKLAQAGEFENCKGVLQESEGKGLKLSSKQLTTMIQSCLDTTGGVESKANFLEFLLKKGIETESFSASDVDRIMQDLGKEAKSEGKISREGFSSLCTQICGKNLGEAIKAIHLSFVNDSHDASKIVSKIVDFKGSEAGLSGEKLSEEKNRLLGYAKKWSVDGGSSIDREYANQNKVNDLFTAAQQGRLQGVLKDKSLTRQEWDSLIEVAIRQVGSGVDGKVNQEGEMAFRQIYMAGRDAFGPDGCKNIAGKVLQSHLNKVEDFAFVCRLMEDVDFGEKAIEVLDLFTEGGDISPAKCKDNLSAAKRIIKEFEGGPEQTKALLDYVGIITGKPA